MEVVFVRDEPQYGDLLLAVTPNDRLLNIYEFKVTDVIKAVDLIERCSVATQRYEGMYAYVFVRQRHVGYMWTQRYAEAPSSLELQNTTTDSEPESP